MGVASDEEFESFVDAHAQALLRSALALTGDRGHAEDLVQTALMRTYASWRRVSNADNPFAYAHRILFTSYARMTRRRRVREVLGADAELPAEGHDHAADDRDRVDRALTGLTNGQRAVVVLRFLEDLSVEQTAQLLGCSTGTVKSQTARALARLRISEELNVDGSR